MKKLFFVIYFFVIISNTHAQKWGKIYGQPNYKEWADDVIEFYDKGYYILGSTEDMEWNFKTDINGDTLYNKNVFHDLYIHRDHASVIDENGNLYICSTIFLDDSWPMVAKYDSCGQKVWCRVFIDDSFDDGKGMDLLLTENGNIIALVNHDSDEQVDQILLYCLNNDGNLLWTESYASKNDHPEISVAVAYNLYHYNNSYFIDGYCYYPYPNGNPNHVFLRPLFIKIDSLFNEEWILPFGVSDSIVGEAFYTIPVSDNIYMGTGALWLEDPVEHSLIMYFNENGEELGYYVIPNDSIGPDVSQNYIVDIERINDSLFLASIPVGYNDEWYEYGDFIIDSTGQIYDFEMRANTQGYSDLIKTSDNKYVIAVEIEENKDDRDILLYKIDKNLQSVPLDTNQYIYDSLCPYPIQSGTIDITDCYIWTYIKDAPTPEEYYASLKKIPVKAYPNPATEGTITFEFKNTEHLSPPNPPQGGINPSLVVFNIFGEKIHKEKIYRYQGKSIVDVSKWGKGMYVAVVYDEGLPVGQCKFVVQ